MVMLGEWLDLMVLEVFSNLNDFMILWSGRQRWRQHPAAAPAV